MLVLSRKLDQSIMIGDDIELIVLGIGRSEVRIGIRAPREISAHRREIYDAIMAQDGRVTPGGNLDARPRPVVTPPGCLPRGPMAARDARSGSDGQPGRGSYQGGSKRSGGVRGREIPLNERPRADRGPHGYPVGMGEGEGGGE